MTDIEDVLSRDFLDKIRRAMEKALYYETTIKVSAAFLKFRKTMENAQDPENFVEIDLKIGKKLIELSAANDIIKKQLGGIIPNLSDDLKMHTNTRNWVVHHMVDNVSFIVMSEAIPIPGVDKKFAEDINQHLDKMERAYDFAVKIFRIASNKLYETTAEKIPGGFRDITIS